MDRGPSDTSDRRDCPGCGAPGARLEQRMRAFQYGEGGEAFTLSAEVPVWACAACNAGFTAEGAEERMHDAVCDHLGRLRPSEIRRLRRQYHMTQEQFAELTKIGAASIKRWEKGALVQNEAMDQYLRLLKADPGNLALLRRHAAAAQGRFRALLSPLLEKAAEDGARFVLRAGGARLAPTG